MGKKKGKKTYHSLPGEEGYVVVVSEWGMIENLEGKQNAKTDTSEKNPSGSISWRSTGWEIVLPVEPKRVSF